MEIDPVFQGDFVAAFLACDEKFLPYTVTTIASIMENSSPGTNYDIVVLTDAVPGEKIDDALAWFARYPNGSLRFYDLGSELEKIGREKFYVTRRYPITVYFRFFAPELFRRYDRVVYLDSDMIILADLADLYHADLGGQVIGACPDVIFEEIFRAKRGTPEMAYAENILGLTPEDGYFNAGMILFDLGEMRRLNIAGEVFAAMERIDSPSLQDQDILNSVCKGRVRFLDGAWNTHDWMADPREDSTKFHFANEDSKAAARRERNRIGILHFAEKKPWQREYLGGMGAYYWHYSAPTPFHNSTRAKWLHDNRPAALLRQLAVTSFHLCRCGTAWLLGSRALEPRNRRRLYDYWMRFKGLGGRLFERTPPGAPRLPSLSVGMTQDHSTPKA